MFRKVLIANRGEIAVRIIHTLRELGVRAVSVYSEADAHSPHVYYADEAHLIGPPPPLASYLNIDAILTFAKKSGVDAIHPGYGFLSENANFAKRCAEAGITFIGPGVHAIEAMGSKVRSREIMTFAGVPVVPGTEGTKNDFKGLAKAAEKMGFPVLIKASAGGGGKGMRVVREAKEFDRAVNAASEEAAKAFGDGTVYLEKYLERPRHIEIQIFADSRGNTVHLFERECSIQRRHQKIVEESPSPAITEKLRAEMSDAAIAAAKAVNYLGAGTVEFLLDETGKFYFLEMNTRLQVEHPVTEMITELDLVRLQIEVALGNALPAEALNAKKHGHAIECRVYAEDPANGFLPASGTVTRLRTPTGPGVRVDSAIREGSEVSVHYDPMLAKLIAYGRDRAEAILRMRRALSQFVVLGLTTNIPHLQAVIETKAFADGNLTTKFLDEHLPDWKPEAVELPAEAIIAASLVDLMKSTSRASSTGETVQTSLWSEIQSFRLLG
ncbi:MAG: acetyl-CoA carboxylase biotin carboxylase subunit [Planctomycetes bacterium]|nr:acetyl-CoA carboxylase biotin carboxylase subunit [Planctomycetota bacterium]